MTTKDASEGDWVRVSYEGELHWGPAMTLHLKQERGELQLPLGYEEITKIDKPVKEGDVIKFRETLKLPQGSIVLNLSDGNPYKVSTTPAAPALVYGDRAVYASSASYRVLHIEGKDHD